MIKKFKGRGRRGSFAAVLVMAAGLMVSGGGYAAATAVVEQTASTVYTESQIEEGKKLFLANCASCHGQNGEGSDVAPSLIGVGAASVDFQVGTGRMPGQASGPQLYKKPVQFTDEQIVAIFDAIRQLMAPPASPRKKIGFE